MIKESNNYNDILFSSLYNDEYNIFLKNLFDYSSIINQKNNLGENLLHIACFYGMIDKYYALINMGAEINKTNKNNTLLHYASFSGKDNFLIVELVKMDLLPTEKNILGETSLHLVENKQIAHYLNLWCIRNNISVFDLKDNNGNYVIHTAKKLGHLDVVEYWKKNYPSLDSMVNNKNQTWKQINTTLSSNHINLINGEN